MTDKQITAFKGFDKDLKCRGFQYEIGKTYEHDGKVEPCESGFHACLNPFDVWSYYSIVGSRFCEVTLSGETKDHSDDSKIAAGRITIEAELTMPAFIKRAVDWLISDTKGKDEIGYSAKIGSSGDYAQIGSSGDSAKIGSSGYYAKIEATGADAVIACAGVNATVSAGDGAWVSVAEFDGNGKCVGFATGRIGKDGLKAGVKYRAKGGKLVEIS